VKLPFYLALILGASVVPGYAAYEAPVDRNTTLTVKYDRQGVPTSLKIWDGLSGGNDDSDPGKWGRNSLTCLSSSDNTNGACPTAPVWAIVGTASIPIKFTEKDTRVEKIINLSAYRIPGPGAGIYYPWSGVFTTYPGAARFYYSIPQSELAKLTAGTWRATLKQNLWQWSPQQVIKKWNADIILTVTDLNNQQIYFPAFPFAAPRIDLNLNNRPGTVNNIAASGSTTLDMCLYDGSNSSSNRIDMIFKDEGASAPGRPAGAFSVYRTGSDKTQPANRIDYMLNVINPTTGASEWAKNGTELNWSNTNQRNRLRQVVLPGVPGVSLCVPAPLTLNTPSFNLVDKAAGHYTGKLTIIYTPSTQSNVP